ncbi:Dps family protein [Frigoriglobus tundricola]|uniref:Non-specific DNA-binding protein Dps / Iron-binding ferritin-like antioxidant protein / Ferroxidase n=1 Tax=Frigoriglobus tundricola TaxID=2774151 RepID=A0A6M5YNT5_9BACT|nr:DNA starvation/stationary phase protection protein [Frigoriglobus tundricola]QJW94632.1 Non-specific DNA-binding protein Dps / Iron-binding ferritin-like antioxidant protein / Ferroxidase [Frigoriglobus tundricola]
MKESALTKVPRADAPPPYEVQAFGTLTDVPIALAEAARREGVDNLNQLLADTITLRDLYRKHHWQASGPTFYMLHLLFDKHYREQDELVDAVAERVMQLGGVSVAMGADVAEMTLVPSPPKGRERTAEQLARLLFAHEVILEEARAMARYAERDGDVGTADLIVSKIIRTNETQVWFVAEHRTAAPAEVE